MVAMRECLEFFSDFLTWERASGRRTLVRLAYEDEGRAGYDWGAGADEGHVGVLDLA